MGKIQYQIITTIKESDKGSVYLATVEGYCFPVIVKWLKHGNRQVFEAIQGLRSTQIPQIYLIEEEKDGLLVAEEYIEGELLSNRIREGTLSEAQYLDIAKQLCTVLAELHHHVPPLIHRDIKPSNIIINSKGVVKLIDFDSSRVYKEDSDGDTRLLGTEKYAAPEQYGFSQTDSRSDIYSLGVVFGNFSEAFSEARKKRWNKLVERCTLFAPESRFQTVEEILREITKIEKFRTIQRMKWGMIAGMTVVLVGAVVSLVKVGSTTKNKGKNGTERTSSSMEAVSLGRLPEDEGTLSPEPSPSPSPSLSPEPSPSPSPSPSPELSPSPSPSPSPELSPSPSPSQSPELSPSPSPSLNPTPSLSEEEMKQIAPVWRDDVNDSLDTIALKRLIRTRQYVVQYYFKENMGEKALLHQESRLERENYEYRGCYLMSEETGKEVRVTAEMKNGMVLISAEEMKKVKAGFYTMEIQMHDFQSKEDMTNSIYLYVAESDPYKSEEMFLQNSTLSYYGGEGEVMHLVAKNESNSVLTELLTEERTPVTPELYRILYDGRVIELSNEFLRTYCQGEATKFYVVNAENHREEFYIFNKDN